MSYPAAGSITVALSGVLGVLKLLFSAVSIGIFYTIITMASETYPGSEDNPFQHYPQQEMKDRPTRSLLDGSWKSSDRASSDDNYVDPEVYMSTIEIITLNGYPAEAYKVLTKDGYLLGLHRIPYGKNGPEDKPRQPVLIMHGALCSSIIWVDNTVNLSLGFILANDGYDVWLSNTRGNDYSNSHVNLTVAEKQFWEFGLDEHGKYDLPDTIDFILEKTGFQEVFLVAHSMGTTMTFIMLSTKQEYNKKVKGVIALAPVAYLGHMTSAPAWSLVQNLDAIEFIVGMLRIYSFSSTSFIINMVSSIMCTARLEKSDKCDNMIFTFAGYDPEHVNRTRMPVYSTHYGAPTSVKTIRHYAQLIKSKRFRSYDYGDMNMKVYNMENPPEYDLTKISAPIAVFYGRNDLYTSAEDLKLLTEKIPNLFLNYNVPEDRFGHVDFMWNLNINALLYDKVKETLSQMSANEINLS